MVELRQIGLRFSANCRPIGLRNKTNHHSDRPRGNATDPEDDLRRGNGNDVSKKRKPSIKTIERRTGKTVSAVTYSTDGSVTYSFGESGVASAASEWDTEIARLTKQ